MSRKQVIRLSGVVQGVGMRPALCRMAKDYGLTGSVCNTARGVELVLYGPAAVLERFRHELPRRIPETARLDGMECSEEWESAFAPEDFTIRDSDAALPAANLAVLPDAAP